MIRIVPAFALSLLVLGLLLGGLLAWLLSLGDDPPEEPQQVPRRRMPAPEPDPAPDGTPPDTCNCRARPDAPAPNAVTSAASENWVNTNEPSTVSRPTTSIDASPDTWSPIEPSTRAGVSVTFAEAGRVTLVQSNRSWPTGA